MYSTYVEAADDDDDDANKDSALIYGWYKAHCAVAVNLPSGLKQFSCPLPHFTNSHDVSGIFTHDMTRFSYCY